MSNAYGMLRAAIAGQDGRGRSADDFYPTPVDVTEALLPEITDFPRIVWEPACGDGAVVRVLSAAGFDVLGTDLVGRGCGVGGVDFLEQTKRRADAIVTNPPFGALASRFIEHAVQTLRTPYVAILSNVNFWHAKRYSGIFDYRRPSSILALTWRPDFTGSARPYFNCIWTVWRPDSPADPVYRRLLRPTPSLESLLG